MPRLDVAVGIIRNEAGQVLISQRAKMVHQGGLWEFPGGKFAAAEDAHQALVRELKEELGIEVVSSTPLIDINFDYPAVKVHLHVRQVDEFIGKAIGREGQAIEWSSIDRLKQYTFPEANKPILSALGLGRQYAIINSSDQAQIFKTLELLAKQGVFLVQIRAKELFVEKMADFVRAVSDKSIGLGIACLFNSSVHINSPIKENVHLTSLDLMQLKERPNDIGLLAASCHNLQELQHAEHLGLDFVVLSPVQSTSSHPDASPLGWQLFSEWVAKVNIPVFSLGGMQKEDQKQAISCGAQGIAGINLFNL